MFVRGIPFPEFRARGRVESDHLASLGRSVEHALYYEVIRLIFGRISGLIGPCNFEVGDVLAIDLFEGRIKIALLSPEINWPIGILTVSQA